MFFPSLTAQTKAILLFFGCERKNEGEKTYNPLRTECICIQSIMISEQRRKNGAFTKSRRRKKASQLLKNPDKVDFHGNGKG